MVWSLSSESLPWCDRPARPFPARIWLEQRLGFRIPRARLAGQAAPSAGAEAPVWERRPFPAKVWLEARRSPPRPGDW